jgi:23S rRNA pseudouridine1911/1915/1917 synthase
MIKDMEEVTLTAGPEHEGLRIDAFIAGELPELTRSAVQRLCGEGLILSCGKQLAKSHRLRAGERVSVLIPPLKDSEVLPQDIPLNIVYEDGELLVVDKPKGMVVHPAAGNADGTLVNALLHHCGESLSGVGGVARPGIVHRIDKDTSGLLVVAKTDSAHRALSEAVKEHSFTRIYSAIVYGNVKEESGTVRAPIGRHPVDRKKMAVTDRHSRDAATHFRALERLSGFTYLELRLETGRTHQIRVHMAYIGHPVAGDAVYGPKKVIERLHGQCLHAGTLGFVHPSTGEYIEFNSPLPAYFTDFLNARRILL